MFVRLRYLFGWAISTVQCREELILENLALRQQLLALHPRQPRLRLGGEDAIQNDFVVFPELVQQVQDDLLRAKHVELAAGLREVALRVHVSVKNALDIT